MAAVSHFNPLLKISNKYFANIYIFMIHKYHIIQIDIIQVWYCCGIFAIEEFGI